MKKKISRILGVAISLAMLTGLMVGSVPASAQDIKALTWGEPYQPGNWTQAATSSIVFADTYGGYFGPGPNIVDMSVSADGNTAYVVCGDYEDFYQVVVGGAERHRVYVASYGGYLWSAKKVIDEDAVVLVPNDTASDNWSIDLVAQAPDNPDVVAIAVSSDNATTTPKVYISTDGANTWTSLGNPDDDTAVTNADEIFCLDVCYEMGSKRYILAGGRDGTEAGLWYFNLGGSVPKWVDAASKTGTQAWDTDAFEDSEAVIEAKFSPNFPSDRTVVVVTGPDDATAVDTKVRIQLASFAGETWNSDFFGTDWEDVAGVFGREIEAITGGKVVQAASISMPTTFMGSDPSTRVVFIGLATDDATDLGNIYRFDDYKRTRILGDDADDQLKIMSVAYNTDADKLVAGEYASNNVLRCANPLVKEPDTYSATSLKRPGRNGATNEVIVAWGGTDVKAGSSGDDNGYSVSSDDGKSFNDIGFIDTHIAAVEDFAIVGGIPYIVTNDGTNLSFWRQSPYSAYFWIRALVVDDDTGYILRVAPDNDSVLYLAKKDDKKIYYTSDAGDTEWLPRYCGVAVQDMAVESADVVYALSAAGKVSKSTDGGFVWSSPATDSKQSTGHSIVSLAEDQALVASQKGGVSYTKDGGESWTTLIYSIGTGNAQVTADGLETGSNIYAARANDNTIYRWTLGTNSTTWTQIGDIADAAHGVYGLELVDGVLYGVSCNQTGDPPSTFFRNLEPTAPEDQVDGKWDWEAAAALAFDAAPTAMRIGTGSTMVWAIDTATSPSLWRYEDSLATAGPTLTIPAEGAVLPANRETGIGYNVVLTWDQQSRATAYEVDVAWDADFTQLIVDGQAKTNADLLATVLLDTGQIGAGLQLVPGKTYYWRVRATAPLPSPWSEASSFSIETLAEAQQAIEPEEPEEVVLEPVVSTPGFAATNVSIRPTFSWTAVPGATYEFVLAEDLGLDDPFEIIDYSATADINAHVAREELKFSTTYHWRVRSISDAGTSEWVRGIFTTMAEPEEAAPPIVIEEKPAPPAPEIILEVPPTPAPVQVIPDYLLWVIVVVGAVLIIAVIVLIVRTRRVT